ncbi:RDD family protein [Chryseobacterium sp. 2TAF14]|uniref:RDD family protein n=1 Tax=Chryseobacterium sp. 2TAF14 TaxID=3233007 RepID=UPI003F9153FA
MGKNYKLIAISSLVISVIGIISCLYSFYGVWKGASGFNAVPGIVRFLFSFTTLNLNFTNRFEHIEIWNFVFYVLLFIGGLQFIKSKGKETRFVGFVFSVIFINAIILSLQSILHKLLVLKWTEITSLQKFFSVFGFVILAATLYISYQVLKTIKNQKQIDIVETETKTTVTDTGKWQRFFHWLIDLTVMSLILIPFLITLGYWLMDSGVLRDSETFRMFFRSRFSLYVIIFIFLFIYYPISEILFGATPAKFLTESRVINSKAEAPNSSTIFLRTLCRNIPFDAFSFLAKRGWHDSLSETYVVKEKRAGFKTNKLLWILPILAIYLAFMYLGKNYYAEYKSNQEYKKETSQKLQFLESEIKNPNIHQFFVVNDINYYGKINNYGFKIEKIEGNEITIKRIMGEFLSESNYSQAKYLYQQQKDTAKTFIIRKDELMKIFPNDMNEYYHPVKTLEFFEPGIAYNIENVYDLDAPFLEAAIGRPDQDYQSEKASVYFTNLGGAGTITAIRNNNNIKWKTKFPLKISNDINDRTVIDVENFKSDEKNISEIEVLDSLNKKHRYLFKSMGLQAEIKEIK